MGKLLVIRDCSVRSVPAHLKHNKPSIERPTYYACSWQAQKIFAAVSPDYSKARNILHPECGKEALRYFGL